jgi:hypothetical protein
LGNATTIWQKGSTNGNDSRFALGAAIELASSLALHCPGRRWTKREQWKIVVMVNISVKALSKVLERSLRKTQSKKPIKYEQIRQDLWKKPWWFCQETIWKHKVCGGIFGRYTHKIAISNHRIRSIDTQNVTFDYKDYRVAGALKQMTLTHEEFIRRFSLHILQTLCKFVIMVLLALGSVKAKAFTRETSVKVLKK